ncbi:hypothetical protein OG897_20530 [Streptomyces sp. NBC_00237]|uniref:WXG100 family type VII secretion target n=1 Tax=Streptomyces sp. NBC_00237 TaxID=2975687 RepID=UPI002253DFF0|nr:hypothetical protein [Streptomyces sp. NBC_00237]MCX5203830.1 hypothetical protein [Streptomyces sp. NBC_00237]
MTAGSGSFETHRLNTMIDLVEAGNPRAVAGAAYALADVRESFTEAAHELRQRLAAVEWKGEAGTEFRRFGTRLANHADDLGTYARVVADQLEQAATGLASVRNSMPPRSTTPETEPLALPGSPADLNRQEALTQLNRLASHYAVAGANLAAAEPPRFDSDLRADVPRPTAAAGGMGGTGGMGSPGDAGGTGGSAGHAPSTAGAHAPPAPTGIDEPTRSHTHPAAPRPQWAPTPPGLPGAPHTTDVPTTRPTATTMELNSLAPGAHPPTAPHPSPPQPQGPAPSTAPPLGPPPTQLGAISGGLPLASTARGGASTGAPGTGNRTTTPAPSTAYGAATTTPSTTGRPGAPTSAPRPLTGIPGVMGGTPTWAASPTTRPAFTQGGAGLVRTQPTNPRTGRRPAPPPNRATEDSETWTSAGPAANPAVITGPPTTHPH